MFRIWIGYDSREPVAYHVLAHSILRRASVPVTIAPIAIQQLGGIYSRARGPLESTEFSMTRFLTPLLAGYDGVCLFLDSDMLCLVDIAELLEEQRYQSDKALLLCKHDYVPNSNIKFLGQPQVAYPRKNWSSLMLFNLQHFACRRLTAEYVNKASGLDLHRFAWIKDEAIGGLPLEWNYLVGESGQSEAAPKIVHFTNGGPWFPEYENEEYADTWRAERDHMLGADRQELTAYATV